MKPLTLLLLAVAIALIATGNFIAAFVLCALCMVAGLALLCRDAEGRE